jgi:hypothetical protein
MVLSIGHALPFPFRQACSHGIASKKWSDMVLELGRKEIECVFGITKKHFNMCVTKWQSSQY